MRRPNLRLATVLLFALCLLSCDIDLFGFGTKQIAGGYRLVQAEGPDEFSIMPPHRHIGSMVTELGWRKPFIISRYGTQDTWEVIDTFNRQTIRISDTERRNNLTYKDIATYPAATAWNQLGHFNGQW